MFSVPLRGDKANDVHRRMNFIRPVKDIKAMEIEVYYFLVMILKCILTKVETNVKVSLYKSVKNCKKPY